MGQLRLLLALIVLISHCGNAGALGWMLPGSLAVRVFYLLSGFYIQLIITDYSQQEHWKRKFYLSRLLRLFPAYYLLLILTMWFNGSTCNSYCVSMVINQRIDSLAFYYGTNFLILGQGFAKFLTYHYSNGSFTFDPNITRPDYWVANMEIMKQGWSLAIELWFYALAPFLLLKDSSRLVIVAFLSLMIKMALAAYGENNLGTWYNGFLPSELHTFILGALAARIALNPQKFVSLKKYLYPCAALMIGLWITGAHRLDLGTDELLEGGIFCLLPGLFTLTRLSRIDRWIGELSYPVYLNHLLVIAFLKNSIASPGTLLIASIALSLAMSIVIVQLVEHPVSRLRHRMFRKPDTLPVRPGSLILHRPGDFGSQYARSMQGPVGIA